VPVRKIPRKTKKAPVKKTDLQRDAEILVYGAGRKPFQSSKGSTVPGSTIAGIVQANGKRGPKSKYDWEGILHEYMTAVPAVNLKQLSLRMNVPYSLLRTRAAKERWNALRNREQLEILKEKRQTFQTEMAREAITFDQTSIDVAKLGQSIIAGRLMEIAKLVAASGEVSNAVVEKLRNGEPLTRGDLYSLVNYKELVSLAQAAQMFQQIGRTALGTDVVDGSILRGEEISADLEKIVSIGGELTKDDPARLASFLVALEEAGLTQLDLDMADDGDTESVQTIEGSIVTPELPVGITTMEGSSDGS
jgi:hypothetical protein